jgi:hypothetical protein
LVSGKFLNNFEKSKADSVPSRSCYIAITYSVLAARSAHTVGETMMPFPPTVVDWKLALEQRSVPLARYAFVYFPLSSA